MPTLPGFLNLKKKRTREGNTDPSPPSNPTSPVTPTSARAFDQSTASLAAPLAHPHPHPSAPLPNSHYAPAGRQDTQPEAAAPSQMNTLPLQQPFPPPQHTPSPGTEPQNLPRISNLINPPQHDGNASYIQAQIGSRYVPPTTDVGAAGLAGSQPPGTMALPQLQQQQQQQLQQSQQAQPPQDQQIRVTKGKYSLADFEILRTLGTGSFGRVHLVQSRHNQRFYAVKVLKKAQVVKMKQVEHTNDERRMLGEVKHPFLITLWGTFQDSRNLYMVMDFVEGGELFSLLRKSGVRWLAYLRTLHVGRPVDVALAFSESGGQILRCGSHVSPGIPTLEKHHLP